MIDAALVENLVGKLNTIHGETENYRLQIKQNQDMTQEYRRLIGDKNNQVDKIVRDLWKALGLPPNPYDDL